MVLKPIDGNHGKGATTNITSAAHAKTALESAQRYSRSIICERFITGYDFRLLVINSRFLLQHNVSESLDYFRPY